MSDKVLDVQFRTRIKYDFDRDGYFISVLATINGKQYKAEAQFIECTAPVIRYPPTDKS